MNEKTLRNTALSLAKRSSDITVQLTQHDIRRLRPEWDQEVLEEFMNFHRAEIAYVMLHAGVRTLLTLAEQRGSV